MTITALPQFIHSAPRRWPCCFAVRLFHAGFLPSLSCQTLFFVILLNVYAGSFNTTSLQFANRNNVFACPNYMFLSHFANAQWYRTCSLVLNLHFHWSVTSMLRAMWCDVFLFLQRGCRFKNLAFWVIYLAGPITTHNTTHTFGHFRHTNRNAPEQWTSTERMAGC